MSAEETKELVRRLVEEAWDKGDLLVVDEVMAPTGKTFLNGLKQTTVDWDSDQRKGLIQAFKAAFPDLRCVVDAIVADGDTVALACTFTGTHTNAWGETPATNKKCRIRFQDFFRIADGKIVELSHPSGTMRYFNAMLNGTLHKEQEAAQSK